jgi:pyruvate/2-oxoglutarate dehydrogenase complex dihydrolipoamide acyltransferase (E2) component
MVTPITIPKLGEEMTEATVIEWRVEEGGRVNKGQIVVVIETEKVAYEMEASADGFVHMAVTRDNKVPVGTVIGMIAESREELGSLQKELTKEVPAMAAEVAEAAPAQVTAGPGMEERVRISPIARKLAEEHGIDITRIMGSGPGGRIVREDIEKAIAEKGKAPAAKVYEDRKVKATIPLRGMRRAIAEHMHQSLSISAQLTYVTEVDVAEVAKLRNELLSQAETIGVRITYTDIFVFALTKALKDNPIINSSLIGDEIRIWEDINIAVAVALEGEGEYEGGLIVPVVKKADKKSLAEISQTIRALTQKARERKLTPDEVTGNTFTFTNLGSHEGKVDLATPILNQPDSAILGAGAIVERPVVRGGQIVIRPMAKISLTFDHRVIDGATAGKFLARVTELLEKPWLLLL